jgi:S1-C subfamily serine protease
MHIGMHGVGSGVTFGVVPDYTSAEGSGGVRISGTTPGTPASGAGLTEGDVIVQFAGKSIDNLYDLSNALAEKKPGQRVKVKFMRKGQPIEVEATLVERK